MQRLQTSIAAPERKMPVAPASTNDMRGHGAAHHPAYSARCEDLGTALPGLLCVPLAAGDIAGVLMADGRSRPFTGEDLSLLASLSRQAAAAIANANAAESSRNFFTHTSELLVSLIDAEDVHYREG